MAAALHRELALQVEDLDLLGRVVLLHELVTAQDRVENAEVGSPALTPDQIYELGLGVVKRIRKEMYNVIAGTVFKGSFAEFYQFLTTVQMNNLAGDPPDMNWKWW